MQISFFSVPQPMTTSFGKILLFLHKTSVLNKTIMIPFQSFTVWTKKFKKLASNTGKVLNRMAQEGIQQAINFIIS